MNVGAERVPELATLCVRSPWFRNTAPVLVEAIARSPVAVAPDAMVNVALAAMLTLALVPKVAVVPAAKLVPLPNETPELLAKETGPLNVALLMVPPAGVK